MSRGCDVRRGDGPLRVLVADAQPLLLEAIVDRLRRHPATAVVATAADCTALVNRYREHRPDIVVCNLNVPPDSVEATREIVKLDPEAKVVVLSSINQGPTVLSCLRAGAVAHVCTNSTGAELVAQVQAVASGSYRLDRATSDLVLGELRTQRVSTPPVPFANLLSEREREVLLLVSEGLSNRCIGERLHVSCQTVKTYLDRIYTKLGVSSRAAAVRQAMEHGLVP